MYYSERLSHFSATTSTDASHLTYASVEDDSVPYASAISAEK